MLGPWEGRYPFTQVDGLENTWFLADSFPADLDDAYTYVNGTDWGNKEKYSRAIMCFWCI